MVNNKKTLVVLGIGLLVCSVYNNVDAMSEQQTKAQQRKNQRIVLLKKRHQSLINNFNNNDKWSPWKAFALNIIDPNFLQNDPKIMLNKILEVISSLIIVSEEQSGTGAVMNDIISQLRDFYVAIENTYK